MAVDGGPASNGGTLHESTLRVGALGAEPGYGERPEPGQSELRGGDASRAARRRPGHRRPGWLAVLASALAGCVFIGAAAFVDKAMSGRPKVVVAVAGPATIEAQPGGTGTISALPRDVFDVSLDTVGITSPITVKQVFVVPGSSLSPGSPLVSFDPAPFQQDLEQVRLTLQEAEATLAANEKDNAGAVAGSYASVYLATEIPQLEGEVALDKQLLSIAEGNSMTIRAPMAGDVSEVNVWPGDAVTPGSPLLQVVNISMVQVTASVQLFDLPAVHVGDVATITPTELPGAELQGRVVAVGPGTTGGGLDGTVLIDAPNPGPGPVPLGTQVFVLIEAPQRAAVAVPSLAVLNSQLDPIIMVVRNGRAYPVAVTVGVSDSDRTAVVSGLSDGSYVAVSNMQQLRAGERVRVTRVLRA